MPDIHPRAPWKDVTFTGAYWNCPDRLENLLTFVRPWFRNIVVAVQLRDEADRTEDEQRTFEIANALADVVLPDSWHGRGDPSISKAAAAVKTKYAFVVSDDEMPDAALLNSFQDLVNQMNVEQAAGAWVPFTSFIDGHDFTRNDSHLRLWEARVPWPPTPHARPMIDNTIVWKTGSIRHDRSLDEMMIDYLRRYDDTAQHPDWSESIQAHNVRMMLTATRAIAELDGPEAVTRWEWWPRVKEIAYGENDLPAKKEVEEKPKPVRRRRRTKTA